MKDEGNVKKLKILVLTTKLVDEDNERNALTKIRTWGLHFRKVMLYPTELPAHRGYYITTLARRIIFGMGKLLFLM
jgi:hypothetical protein